HNAICDRLRDAYPSWSDDNLFEHARLINAALLAKIHTVEWTPAVISHPTTTYALRANWWGIEMEKLHKLVGRLSDSEVLSGIPGSETDHYGVPYSLTEEFVAVYKMHPLIPDDYSFRSIADDTVRQTYAFPDVAQANTVKVIEKVSMTDLFYSFGTMNPGAISLHNYPKGLQQFLRPDGYYTDLAATDILRAREMGVPRYTQFRKLLGLRVPRTFEELSDNPDWVNEIRRIYDNNLDLVDLLVGLYAEPKPAGFGFSDTAFRIFILMASRRLNSDRFFTVDFTPTVYTPEGMDWIANNTMQTVLLRHYPELAPAFRGVENAFAPWTRTVV
ncbi:MAG TPA: peroxidase family protein, partial [Chloroflexota bacterium]|nr:peroxidase family protein [Chloroflexota bacterium]